MINEVSVGISEAEPSVILIEPDVSLVTVITELPVNPSGEDATKSHVPAVTKNLTDPDASVNSEG